MLRKDNNFIKTPKGFISEQFLSGSNYTITDFKADEPRRNELIRTNVEQFKYGGQPHFTFAPDGSTILKKAREDLKNLSSTQIKHEMKLSARKEQEENSGCIGCLIFVTVVLAIAAAIALTVGGLLESNHPSNSGVLALLCGGVLCFLAAVATIVIYDNAKADMTPNGKQYYMRLVLAERQVEEAATAEMVIPRSLEPQKQVPSSSLGNSENPQQIELEKDNANPNGHLLQAESTSPFVGKDPAWELKRRERSTKTTH